MRLQPYEHLRLRLESFRASIAVVNDDCIDENRFIAHTAAQHDSEDIVQDDRQYLKVSVSHHSGCHSNTYCHQSISIGSFTIQQDIIPTQANNLTMIASTTVAALSALLLSAGIYAAPISDDAAAVSPDRQCTILISYSAEAGHVSCIGPGLTQRYYAEIDNESDFPMDTLIAADSCGLTGNQYASTEYHAANNSITFCQFSGGSVPPGERGGRPGTKNPVNKNGEVSCSFQLTTPCSTEKDFLDSKMPPS